MNKINPFDIYINLINPNEAAYLAMVQKDGLALKTIPNTMLTPAICTAAVEENINALRYVPLDKRTLPMCILAVTKDAKKLKHVPLQMKKEVINAVSIKSIVENNCFAIQYFPNDMDLQTELNKILASVKDLVIAGPKSDGEVQDATLIYAHRKKNKRQIASVLFGKKATLATILSYIAKISASAEGDLQLTLIGHSGIYANGIAGLDTANIAMICDKFPRINHVKLFGCNVAQSKITAEEREMEKNYLKKVAEKDQLRYGLITTYQAQSNDKDFQQRCLKFCIKNDLNGVYALNKTEAGHYQLFSMKVEKNETSHTIVEKVKDVLKPNEIQNILENRKPFIFPHTNTFIPIRQKDNLLKTKELMALRNLAYKDERLEKTHPHYEKDKKTYPFLAKIKVQPDDLDTSVLKKLARALKDKPGITRDITIEGPAKLVHVNAAHKSFAITQTPLYDSRMYKKSLFHRNQKSIIDQHAIQKEQQHAIRDLKEGKKSFLSSARQIKVLISKKPLFNEKKPDDSPNTRELNYWEKRAVTKLSSFGITSSILHDRYKINEFKYEHYYALENLIQVRHVSLNAALDTLQGLTNDQVDGIKEGLERDDVIGLTNGWHIITMQYLKAKGLTPNMLLTLDIGQGSFDMEHSWALRNLVLHRKFSVQDAMLEIKGLAGYQVNGIKEGLLREDVIHLTNYWHISVLASLKAKGLTANMLLTRNEGGHPFDSEHCFALQKLVLNKNYSVEEALKIIDGISHAEAGVIHNDRTNYNNVTADAPRSNLRMAL